MLVKEAMDWQEERRWNAAISNWTWNEWSWPELQAIIESRVYFTGCVCSNGPTEGDNVTQYILPWSRVPQTRSWVHILVFAIVQHH